MLYLQETLFHQTNLSIDTFVQNTLMMCQLSLFLALLNLLHPDVNFTSEITFNKQFYFLDLTVTRSPNDIKFNIYGKPIFTDTCMSVDSYQTCDIKLFAFNITIHEIAKIPLSAPHKKQQPTMVIQPN